MGSVKNSTVFRTCLGWAGIAVSEQGVCKVVLPSQDKRSVQRELDSAAREMPSTATQTASGPAILKKAVKLLRRYFSGECVSFDLPLDLRYYTPFQQAVLRAVAAIPYGVTRSYAWVARRIGNPRAFRAVGQANGANLIPIVIP